MIQKVTEFRHYISSSLSQAVFIFRFGRKKCIFPSFFMLTTFSLIQSFAPNIWSFIIIRVIVGIFEGGVLTTLSVMSVELVGPKYRALGGNIIWLPWPLAISFMSLQSYYMPKWRTLLIILTAPYFIIALGAK